MSQILMNQDYFRIKNNAEDIIKLQEFLINKNIRQENLKDRAFIRTMMRETAKKFADRQPMTLEMDTFKKTIDNFTIDHLKEVKLFRINYGILTVACVEHLLYPGQDNEEYMRIYCCDKQKAIEVYHTLRGFPDQDRTDDITVRSARSFFNCKKFSNDNQYLEAIRSYLRSLQINNEDMQYIREKSIELIDTLEPKNILVRPVSVNLPSVNPEERKSFIDRDYFLEKSNAYRIIRLRNYLNENAITEESLENNANLINILRKAMNLFLNDEPTEYYLDTFRNTILDLTIDHLKEVKLYRMNYGILAVACVEYLLYPGDDIEEFMRIYSCDRRRVTKIYNKLRDFSEDRVQDVDTLEKARAFFNCENCLRDNDDYLSTIRWYLRDLQINRDDLEYIKNESRRAIESTPRQEQHEFLIPRLPPPIARRPQPIARRPQPIAQPAQPDRGIQLTRQYFYKKTNAHIIIRLVEYLNSQDIKEQDLERVTIVREILRSTMRTFANRNPTPSELHTFRNTIRDYPIDYLKEVNLFYINRGILVVACVEHLLYPRAGNEQYSNIYRCSKWRATMLFNKLCGYSAHNRPDKYLVNSTRNFIKSPQFLIDNRYLQAIRSYLERIYIDDDELAFIKAESTRVIHERNERRPAVPVDLPPNAQPLQLIDQPPPPNARSPEPEDRPAQPNAQSPSRHPQILITREYFQTKSEAHAIIKLVNYLKNNNITEQELRGRALISMMRETTNAFADRNPTPSEFNTFKNTILDVGIDYWTAVSLYRINPGILAVACVEHLLYPGEDNEEYMRIYCCDEQKAIEVYHTLRGFPDQDRPDDVTVRSARSFFNCENYITDNDDYLSTIREYLGNLQINVEELECIKEKSIELIDSHEAIDQLPAENIIDPVEDQPLAENIIDLVEDQPLAENIIDPIEDQPLAEDIIDPIEDQPLAEDIIDPIEDQPLAENIIDPVEDQPLAEDIIDPIEDQPLAENIIDPIEDQPLAEDIIDPIEDQPLAENIIDPVEDQPLAENIIDPIEDQPLAENIIDPVEDQPLAENIMDYMEDQPLAENIMDYMEDQPLNLRENNEQPRPLTPENHAPPPVVPIPVNHQFTLRYGFHQKIMAYRESTSFFWPAKIMKLNNHSMTVEFFPGGERQVISSIDDIKSMEKETYYEIYASLPRELRGLFRMAVRAALGENVNDRW